MPFKSDKQRRKVYALLDQYKRMQGVSSGSGSDHEPLFKSKGWKHLGAGADRVVWGKGKYVLKLPYDPFDASYLQSKREANFLRRYGGKRYDITVKGKRYKVHIPRLYKEVKLGRNSDSALVVQRAPVGFRRLWTRSIARAIGHRFNVNDLHPANLRRTGSEKKTVWVIDAGDTDSTSRSRFTDTTQARRKKRMAPFLRMSLRLKKKKR